MHSKSYGMYSNSHSTTKYHTYLDTSTLATRFGSSIIHCSNTFQTVPYRSPQSVFFHLHADISANKIDPCTHQEHE